MYRYYKTCYFVSSGKKRSWGNIKNPNHNKLICINAFVLQNWGDWCQTAIFTITSSLWVKPYFFIGVQHRSGKPTQTEMSGRNKKKQKTKKQIKHGTLLYNLWWSTWTKMREWTLGKDDTHHIYTVLSVSGRSGGSRLDARPACFCLIIGQSVGGAMGWSVIRRQGGLMPESEWQWRLWPRPTPASPSVRRTRRWTSHPRWTERPRRRSPPGCRRFLPLWSPRWVSVGCPSEASRHCHCQRGRR